MSKRFHDYRCRCGLEEIAVSDTKLGPIVCAHCGLTIMWWRSRSVVPFVPPPKPELSERELAELRDWGNSWRALRAHRFKAPEAGEGVASGNEHPNAPEAAAVPVARLESDGPGVRRVRLPEAPSEEREQLGFGFSEPDSGGGMHNG